MTTDDYEDQSLIQAVSRVGLKAVKSDVQCIFKIVEQTYRVETSMNLLKKIDTKNMVIALLKNPGIQSLYNAIVSGVAIFCDKEVKENLLEKMISLYLRVRAFSTAKDKIQKYRNEQKQSKSKKGLRKSLKKAAQIQNIETDKKDNTT